MEEIGFGENIKRKRGKSEAIPSLLLVNDDIISPITVLFDTTKLILTGENITTTTTTTTPPDGELISGSNISKTDRPQSNSKEESSPRITSGETQIFLQSTKESRCQSFSQETQAGVGTNQLNSKDQIPNMYIQFL